MARKIKESSRIYFMDTSYLLHNPNALHSRLHIVLPAMVIKELDNHKKKFDTGPAARRTLRILEKYRKKGDLTKGVEKEHGGTIRIERNHRQAHESIPVAMDLDVPDDVILTVAYNLQMQENRKKRGKKTIYVTSNDLGMRVTTQLLGLRVDEFEGETPSFDEFYKGWREIKAPTETINNFRLKERDTPFSETAFIPEELSFSEATFFPNEFVHLMDECSPKNSVFARYNGNLNKFVPLNPRYRTAYKGLTTRNKEQMMALELLLDPSIPCVTLVGQAGSGKTLLALAAGLRMMLEENRYEKMLVVRPIIPMGNDIGYVPGDKDNKLGLWMEPIFDNLHFLLGRNMEQKDATLKSLIDGVIKKYIELGSLAHIRGRSIRNQYIIIDEAQNLTPHEVKTILSRAGEGAKIVLTGDPKQIDNPYVDSLSNGLVHAIEKSMKEPIVGHIYLPRTLRSELASFAANAL